MTSLNTVVQGAVWKLRGVVETDDFRRAWFGLRELAQRTAYAKRRASAADLPDEPGLRIPRDHGFRVFPPGEFPESRAVADYVTALAESAAHEVAGKPFHQNKLVEVASADVGSPLFRVALHPSVVAAASRYLGAVPVLAHVDVFASRPQPEGVKFSKSQLFHCDDTCVDQLKIFIYGREVTDDDGPLNLIDAKTSAKVRRSIGYRYAGTRYRVSDATMAKHASREAHHIVKGSAGTVLVADTSRCFHFGSRIRDPDRWRVVGVIQFVPPSSLQLPLRFTQGAPFRHLATSTMDPLTRMVLGAE